MNDDFQSSSNELSRIPCPLCRQSMRLQLNLRILMTQYKYMCKHCKDKLSYIGDKMCICKDTTQKPVVQEENELCKRIKNFFKSIVPSPRLIHKTKILPLLDEYNPFESLSVPNFRDDDIKLGQMKIADSEPNLSGVRPSDDEPFHKYAETDRKDSKVHLGYKNVGKEDIIKSERKSSATRLQDARGIVETTTDLQDGKKTATKDVTSSEAHEYISKGEVKEMDSKKVKAHAEKDDDVSNVRKGKDEVNDKEKEKKEQKVTARTEKYGDVSKVKKGKNGDEKQASKEGANERGVNSDKQKDTSENLAKKGKESDKGKTGAVEGKVRKGKDDVDKKYTDKEKNMAKDKIGDVGKYAGAEGKVKKGKDDGDEKHIDKEKKMALEAVKREKGVDKEKVKKEQETSKGKDGVEGKFKSDKGDDTGKDSKAKTGDNAKVVKEEKGTKGKSVDKGKQQKENEAIPLEGLLLIDKMRSEAQKKKAQNKEKKEKGDGDKKTDNFRKKQLKGALADETELDVNNDKADEDQVLLRVKEAQKLNPRENKEPPKIFDLIHKLKKSPRVKDDHLRRAIASDRVPSPVVSLIQLLNKPSPHTFKTVIVGNRLIKYKPPMPRFSECQENSIAVNQNVIYVKYEENPQIEKDKTEHSETKAKLNDQPMGVMCYALSDRSFIDRGITVLPTEKIIRKLNVYRMRPSNPENNWFARNRHKKNLKYCSGQKLAVFDEDQRCRIYYKNGNLALDYYEAEEEHALQRLVLYSDGENDLKQKVPVTVLATFDHIGTGIIFDKKGNVRAKYNQNEGVVLDKTLGPYTKWKWHQLNDPPILEEIIIETVLPVKDPLILLSGSREHLPKVVDEGVLEIEFQNSLKERGKKIFKSYKPLPVKIKAIKINDQFSLHIIDQSHINLSFRDGLTSFRIDVGMILDCNEIIYTEASEMGQVSVPFEQKPACSSSILNLQRSVELAQVIERKRLSRSKRQQLHVEPCASLERMRSVLSQPLRKQLQGHHRDTALSCPCTQNYTFK